MRALRSIKQIDRMKGEQINAMPILGISNLSEPTDPIITSGYLTNVTCGALAGICVRDRSIRGDAGLMMTSTACVMFYILWVTPVSQRFELAVSYIKTLPKMPTAFEQASAEFRKHLPDLNTPRFIEAKDQDCHEYVQAFLTKKHPPWIYRLTEAWTTLYQDPFKGVTTDGNVIPNLFKVQDEGVDIKSIVAAMQKVVGKISTEQKQTLSYPLDAREWRAWSNPEFLLRHFGLRLDEVGEDIALSILDVIKATFSPQGYEKAISAMRINHFLGQLCKVEKVMNKYSYNFLLFGTPSETEPWGWSLYGHHLCLSVFLKGPQIVISPTFTGAEPNIIDEGEWSGTEILHAEGNLGLQLMQSLSESNRDKAQIFKDMYDPAMNPTGDLIKDRWNKDDQRHLCGAFRDNRIVPYEGVSVASFTDEQKQLVLDIAEQFLLYLPDKARAIRKETIKRHFDSTYFCWIGKYGNDDPYYFRLQSPVIICEFDHHSGVFLTNGEPAKYHTHTLVRTPNGGDYGAVFRNHEKL